MPDSVFISHAGPDSPVALEVAKELEAKGLDVQVDREQLRQGDRFLHFMEQALSGCDYCLLLWSEAAAKGKWVAVEWEAALYRAIQESRRFLFIGRLDPQPLPALLGPRLRVNLFPALYPGMAELLAEWQKDLAAEQASGRPVANGRKALEEDGKGETVYLTSELFGLTQPLKLDLDVPAGVPLDRVVADLGLPRRLDHRGVMGVTYEYRFAHEDAPLARAKSLSAQGVSAGAVLWLEVEMKPFAAGEAVAGQLGQATFRGDESALRRPLTEAVKAAGFGVRPARRRRP